MSRPDTSILLAHAHARMRAFLRAQFAGRYRVRPVESREAARRKIDEEPPDLLIVDAELPASELPASGGGRAGDKAAGMALCRAVKSPPEPNAFPVILLVPGEETEGGTGTDAEEGADERLRVGTASGKTGACRASDPGSEDLESDAASEAEGLEAEGTSRARPDVVLTKPFDVGTLRRCARQLLVGEVPRQRTPESEDFLKRVLRRIDEHLGDPGWTVGDLADAVDLSRRHLTRRLKAEVGKTPAALLRARRIEVAKRRLRDGQPRVREVAQDVGFRSPSHFSQAFRKQVGQLPSTYRDEHVS